MKTTASAPPKSQMTWAPGIALAARHRSVCSQPSSARSALKNTTQGVMVDWQCATIFSNSPRLARVQGQWGWANSTSVKPRSLRWIVLPLGHSAMSGTAAAGEFRTRRALPTRHRWPPTTTGRRRRTTANAEQLQIRVGESRESAEEKRDRGRKFLILAHRVTCPVFLSTRDARLRNRPSTFARVE